MRGVGKVLDAGEQGRDNWSVADVQFIQDGDLKPMAFPHDCEAVSITPRSEADAVILFTVQSPNGIVVTSKSPFVGYLVGPVYATPFYTPDSSGYTVQMIFWTARPEYIPPSFLNSDLCPAARRKFSI